MVTIQATRCGPPSSQCGNSRSAPHEGNTRIYRLSLSNGQSVHRSRPTYAPHQTADDIPPAFSPESVSMPAYRHNANDKGPISNQIKPTPTVPVNLFLADICHQLRATHSHYFSGDNFWKILRNETHTHQITELPVAPFGIIFRT